MTLLLLLRKFVLAVLVVIVSLIILSSIGVNIGPLIAGAGVVGLAIGFGAQTLVKDIIAALKPKGLLFYQTFINEKGRQN